MALDWSDAENHTLDVKENVESFDHSPIRREPGNLLASRAPAYVDRGNTLLTEGTYVADNTYQASYKLPAAGN
jgi:hypothetical protein